LDFLLHGHLWKIDNGVHHWSIRRTRVADFRTSLAAFKIIFSNYFLFPLITTEVYFDFQLKVLVCDKK